MQVLSQSTGSATPARGSAVLSPQKLSAGSGDKEKECGDGESRERKEEDSDALANAEQVWL